MRTVLKIAAILLLGLAGCERGAEAAGDRPAANGAHAAIAWREGDVEDAFAEAAETGKPVLLYWGAVWCPPCNRLKAGLFQDPEFVARTREFVPVYLDGDSRGAQAWGERFGVKGYPTIIILRPDRSEVTRLAGGGDADQLAEVLKASAGRLTSSAELLQRALATPRRLKPDDWTLLSQYGWDVDANRLVKEEERAGVLRRLSQAAPTPVLQRRFALLALGAEVGGEEAVALPALRQAEARGLLQTVLANPAEVRANRGTLIYAGSDLVAAASPDPARRGPLAAALIRALDGVYADQALDTDDRLSAIHAEIALFRQTAGETAVAPAFLLDKVRRRVAWADRTAATPYERQSAISSAAGLLEEVGDKAGAERLLVAELERSRTPYYYMPDLAGLAQARGDTAAAVDWYRKGYETAEGPATRVQWGVLYVNGLIELTPRDKAGIERAATRVIGELANQPDSYHQRTRQRFDTLGKALQAWSAEYGGADVLAHLRASIRSSCASQTDAAARTACEGWLSA